MHRSIAGSLVAAAILAAPAAYADPEPCAEGQPCPSETQPEMVRARFASRAPLALVERRACALRPVSLVDERGTELDIQLETRRCRTGPMPEGAIAVVVRMEVREDDTSYVVIEAQPRADVSLGDLREAITDMGKELKSTLEHPPAAAPSPGEPPPATEMETKTVWYGAQTLAADGISAALCATIFGILIGVPGLVIAAPIVHWVHGNVAGGFESLGLRVGLAAGAGGIGAAIGAGIAAGCSFHSCDGAVPAGAVIGTIVGGLTAIALDAGYLAYEQKRVPKAVTVLPSLVPTGQGLAAGVVGVF